MIFRRCHSHPNFEVSACGIVRRVHHVRQMANGSMEERPAKVIKPVKPESPVVWLEGDRVRWRQLVLDAWKIELPTTARIKAKNGYPRPSYPDGIVVTLAELHAQQWPTRADRPLPLLTFQAEQGQSSSSS